MDIQNIDQIPGAFVAIPEVHGDERGSFVEVIRESTFGTSFVQSNHSRSQAGVLRGLHYHRKQSDAWYVMNGEAQAMMADLRTPTGSPAVVSVTLKQGEPKILFIPPGVAHGFYSVTDLDLIYWVTHYYDSTDEYGVAWDDPTLSCPWSGTDPILSGRDQNNPKLEWSSINLS